MIRNLSIFLCLLFLLLIGPGCLELLVTTQLNPDNSANRVFSVYMDYGDTGQEFQRELARPFTERNAFFHSTFKRSGVAELVALRKYAKGTKIIWEEEFRIPDFNKVNDMGGLIMFNVAMNAQLVRTEYIGKPVWAYRESWWLVEDKIENEREDRRTPYPLGLPFAEVNKDQRNSGLLRPFVASSIGITDRYDVTMPGKIIASNADRFEGNNAVWLFNARLVDRHMWAICERE